MIVDKIFSSSLATIIWKVEGDSIGLRLDQFVKKFYNNYSRNRIQKEIDAGNIKIAGRIGKASTKLLASDLVSVTLKSKKRVKSSFKIIYQDEQMIVINKDPHFTVHPTGRYLFDSITVLLGEEVGEKLYSVHRLDRETSGILLLAKDKMTAQRMGVYFRSNSIDKFYFFIARGRCTEKFFKVKKRVGSPFKNIERIQGQYYDEESAEGKEAETNFYILDSQNNYTIGLAMPITGRQHQIRLHLLSQNLPIIGDKLYLGNMQLFLRYRYHREREEDRQLMQLDRQALHACYLKSDHFSYYAPLSADLVTFLRKINFDPSVIEQEIKLFVTNYERSSFL